MDMAGARFFQFYLDNYFKFPKEIKNDIIYCQRAFHAHLKVHQLVAKKIKTDDSRKNTILRELEDEMMLINGEQNYLLLRLRRVLDEFYKTVQRGGIPIDHELTNLLIFKEVGPYIHDSKHDVLPVSVAYHNTEEKLMEKYFGLAQNEQESAETSSPEAAANALAKSSSQHAGGMLLFPTMSAQVKTEFSGSIHGALNGSLHAARNHNNPHPNHLSQVSLLKPMSQRMVSSFKNNIGTRALYPEQPLISRNQRMTLSNSAYARNANYPSNANALPVLIKEEPAINLPVSKNVTLSRLNLQQALKKAKTDTMAAKASANILAKSAVVPAPPPLPVAPVAVVKTKNEPKTKAGTKAPVKALAINAAAATTRTNKARAASSPSPSPSSSSSSSEDSSPIERDTETSPYVHCPREVEEHKTQAEDYGQEMFLRIFGLVTPEMHVQMQQRRSKRKRRTVQSNERADFHYGRIEYGVHPAEDKQKKKAFLLSPQVKHTRKRKCISVDKAVDDSPVSRSGSSSPDEKRACNECLKRRGSIDQCLECKGYFHQSCHPAVETDAKTTSGNQLSTRSLTINQYKFCPACIRAQMVLIKKEVKQYETLNSTVQDLAQKLTEERQRRASLQHTSKLYKTQMRNLFNIVKTIKSDNEMDSSD